MHINVDFKIVRSLHGEGIRLLVDAEEFTSFGLEITESNTEITLVAEIIKLLPELLE